MKHHKDTPPTPIRPVAPAPKAVEMNPMCIVCGSYEGEMPGKAGSAQWHKGCEESHPAVVAKVKARA